MPGCTIISTVSSSFAYLTIILMKYLVCQKASKIGLVSASQFALVVSLNWGGSGLYDLGILEVWRIVFPAPFNRAGFG
jgi:hypothetical protein